MNYQHRLSRLLVALMFVATLPLLHPRISSLAFGQVGSDKSVSVSKVERKNKAPVSKEILKVSLPKPVEATLDNGISVLIMEDHRFPTVYLQLQINGAGGLYDPPNLPGLADATASMLREGTKTRTSRKLAEDIDRLGASLSASAGFGSSATYISASGLSDNFDEWFQLMTDVLFNPTFPSDELGKYKTRMKVQLKQQRSQPSFMAYERFFRVVYGDHPAAIISTTDEALDALTSDALAKWHHDRYVPQGAILGIAGDVSASELIPKLRQWLGSWKQTDYREVFPPNPAPVASEKIYIVDRPNSVQTTLMLGNIAIDRLSPDYFAMYVMNRVVGGGPAARLFINLREEKGYTYGVYSSLVAQKYPGPWVANGDVRTEVTEGAMTEFMKEINRIRDEKVPPTELDECERSLVASFALSLERPTQLLSYALTRKYYGLPDDYWDTYPAKLMATTAEDVQRVARKYLDPAALQIVAVGEGTKIKSVLEKFGPVEVYDTEGKKK
jgi:predicted Zn-dependent peptidase